MRYSDFPIIAGTQHRFTADDYTWGYARHTMLNETTTRDPETNREAFLEDGKKIRISTIVRVIDDSTGLLWIDDDWQVVVYSS